MSALIELLLGVALVMWIIEHAFTWVVAVMAP